MVCLNPTNQIQKFCGRSGITYKVGEAISQLSPILCNNSCRRAQGVGCCYGFAINKLLGKCETKCFISLCIMMRELGVIYNDE